MADTAALIAHLLRRTSFGPHPGAVEGLLSGGYPAAVDAVLATPALPPFPMPATDAGLAPAWMSWMVRPDAGLHEKMTWFWHGHLTTSLNAVNGVQVLYDQHLLLRRHALGNFRDLVQAMTVNPAMLQYLNGDGSTGDSPNENYGRELMELFTLGRGAYNQAEVRAAARALAGWSVTGSTAAFDPAAAYQGGSLSLLGQPVTTAADVVNTVCNHPACAPFVTTRIFRYLSGGEPSSEQRDRLAGVFRANNLEIAPLVAAILRDPDFGRSRMNRPRYPVEWAAAATIAMGLPPSVDTATAMGQTPFDPPNVAGWAPGPRWLAASMVLARTALAAQAPPISDVVNAADPVAATLRRAGLYEVSDVTRSTLGFAAATTGDASRRAAGLLALAVASPEFALA